MTNDENSNPEIANPNVWKMPEPVFRTSEGKAHKRAEAETEEEDLHETKEQPSPASPAKSSKMPFLLGGVFVIFFVTTILLAGIWFLFLRNIEPPKILSPEVEKSTPETAPAVEIPSFFPAEIAYKTPMVFVPAGEIAAGDDASKKVALPGFYIDKNEVTNAEYKEFCDAAGRAYPPDFLEPDYFLKRPEAPVVGVSIADAEAFALWSGKRLPTEPEWERAAAQNALAENSQFPWSGGNMSYVGFRCVISADDPRLKGQIK